MNVICGQCHKEQEARVTREPPHRVTCRFCGQPINGINDFTVRSLVHRKQFVNEEKGKFSFHCENCDGVFRGHLVKDDGEPYVKCSNCGEKMDRVSDFTIRLMAGITFTDETK